MKLIEFDYNYWLNNKDKVECYLNNDTYHDDEIYSLKQHEMPNGEIRLVGYIYISGSDYDLEEWNIDGSTVFDYRNLGRSLLMRVK